jgi:hypothetical protein
MVTFTAYFDESGTHDGAPVSVMAGFVGNARQWLKFEKRAGRLFGRYRVDIFHTIDVRRGDADFQGWTVDRKLKFLDELQHIANDTLLGGVTSVIRNEDYEYYSNLSRPTKARHDSKYGIMFRGCMAHVVDVIGEIPIAHEPRLNIVLEDGHRNAADVSRIYKSVQDRLGPSASRLLSGLTFAAKGACLPLAAADLLAYSAFGQEVGQKPIGMLRAPSKSEASYRGNLFRVDLNRDSLDSLHEQAMRFAEERRGRNSTAK